MSNFVINNLRYVCDVVFLCMIAIGGSIGYQYGLPQAIVGVFAGTIVGMLVTGINYLLLGIYKDVRLIAEGLERKMERKMER